MKDKNKMKKTEKVKAKQIVLKAEKRSESLVWNERLCRKVFSILYTIFKDEDLIYPKKEG